MGKVAIRSPAPACWWPATRPFCWGETVTEAAHTAVIVEELAAMAWMTLAINPARQPISPMPAR